MSWTISIPFKDRSEPLSATAGFARHLPTDDDRAVARQIVFGAMERGVRTAGDLLDEIAGLEPGQRREMLDTARVEVGLDPIDDVEARERRSAPLAVGPAPIEPTSEIRQRPDGSFYEMALKPEHWTIGPSGQPVELGMAAADASRQAAEERSIAARRQAREQERQHDADALADYEQARREQLQRETPLGVPVP